ncbi:hypothetical protein IWQ61_008236 [Dispira simplex]|nr:hypothetical protein IWQ61_008236 [Dispira simplex]
MKVVYSTLLCALLGLVSLSSIAAEPLGDILNDVVCLDVNILNKGGASGPGGCNRPPRNHGCSHRRGGNYNEGCGGNPGGIPGGPHSGPHPGHGGPHPGHSDGGVYTPGHNGGHSGHGSDPLVGGPSPPGPQHGHGGIGDLAILLTGDGGHHGHAGEGHGGDNARNGNYGHGGQGHGNGQGHGGHNQGGNNAHGGAGGAEHGSSGFGAY